jgi:2-methylisocitrate lyase-like PEP mutase family enzyme
MANLVEDGATPCLAPKRLAELGYKIAAHPLTLLSSAARAMQEALAHLRAGEPVPRERRLGFAELQALVGFPEYDAEASRYATEE